MIVAGSFIMGFAIKNMYDPMNLVTGGVSGAAIIVKSLTGIPLWATNTVLNIPLFLAAWRLKGWNFIRRTLVATVSLSVSLYVIPEMPLVEGDLFLSAVFGGIVSGVGTGLVFLYQATTGGTDMLAALMQLKLRHYSIAQIMQFLDGAVVVAGASLFGIRHAFYAILAIYAVCKVSDGILDGMKFAKQAVVISDRSEEIAGQVMDRLERGVTAVDATGMYSGRTRKMLFCVVSRKELVILRDIVKRIDPRAFVIVDDVREVFGEGFIEET
ncbi:MAG: YitT family protein [Lachnospiraceae bacterium]|nr:YitT family protein [Lachnospiraceae bacterium]